MERDALTRYKMTRRARWYLTVLGLRHFSIGLLALVAPVVFDNESFMVIRRWLPIPIWGLIFLGVGIIAPLVAWMGREQPARFFILTSLTISCFWGASFVAEIGLYGFGPGVAAPVWAVIWLSLAAKDLVISAMPLRSPFEDLMAEEERKWQEAHPPSHG